MRTIRSCLIGELYQSQVMEKFNTFLMLCISVFFIACNKDEDIVVDKPQPEPEVEMAYTVVEYLPAPGQFINESSSGFGNITTMQEACDQAQYLLQQNHYVSLGAWGGYIVVKFHSSIPNKGGYNFAIAGNNFDSSNEPGIVWVMQDSNGNGKPDDTWYQLQGSYYGQSGFEKDFWVTYYRPEPGKDTLWKDCEGNEGYISWLGNYHNQDFYYPNWVKEDSYTLHGSKLPARTEMNPVSGIWSNLPFDWGYVDNSGSDMTTIEVNGKSLIANTFRLYDAIDNEGNTVAIDSIDFIKVQTAIMGSANILGENSTEVCGFFVIN